MQSEKVLDQAESTRKQTENLFKQIRQLDVQEATPIPDKIQPHNTIAKEKIATLKCKEELREIIDKTKSKAGDNQLYKAFVEEAIQNKRSDPLASAVNRDFILHVL